MAAGASGTEATGNAGGAGSTGGAGAARVPYGIPAAGLRWALVAVRYLTSRPAARGTPGAFQPRVCAALAPPAGSAPLLAPNSPGRSDGADPAAVGPTDPPAGRCCVHLRALWWYKWIKLGNTRTRIKLLLYTAAVSSLRLPSSSNAYWSSLCGDPGKLLCSPPQPIILSGYYHTPETKGKHSSNLGRNHHLLFLGILSKHFLLSSYTVRKRNPTLLSLFQEWGGKQCQRPMAVSGYNNCLFRSTHKTYGRVLQEGNVVWRDVFMVSLQRLCSLSPCYCLSALKWLLYSQNSVAMDVKAAALWFWVLLFRQKTLALLQSPFPTAFQR